MITRPRILFICSWYPTKENPNLGIFIRKHAQFLAAAGNDVVTWSFKTIPEPVNNGFRVIKSEEDNLVEYQVEIIKSNLISAFLLRRKIMKQLSVTCCAEHFEKVILQVFNPAWKYWILIRNHFQVAPSLVEHWSGYLPEDGRFKKNSLNGFFLRWICSRLKTFYVVSKVQQKAIESYGIRASFELLPNAVDERIFFFNPKVNRNADFTLLHISNLSETEKQIDFLFRFFKVISERYSFVRLHIAGGSMERISKLQKTFREHTFYKRLSWESILKPEQVAERMQTSHVTVLSSKFEGQPVVLLESMACGTPVLAPAVGGIPDMVNEGSGRMFEAGNLDDMVRAFEEIYSRYQTFNSVEMSRRICVSHGWHAVVNSYKNA